MQRWSSGLIAGACAYFAVSPVFAQNMNPTDIRACTGIESDAQRLACGCRLCLRKGHLVMGFLFCSTSTWFRSVRS